MLRAVVLQSTNPSFNGLQTAATAVLLFFVVGGGPRGHVWYDDGC